MTPPKPKRPFTCYNIFAQLERHYILQMNQKKCSMIPKKDSIDQNAAERPKRYRDVILPLNWYVVGQNRKKRHDRENHGVISFHDLTIAISQSWKSADEETKLYCKNLAQKEYQRYQDELSRYTAKYGSTAKRSRCREQEANRKLSTIRTKKNTDVFDNENDHNRIAETIESSSVDVGIDCTNETNVVAVKRTDGQESINSLKCHDQIFNYAINFSFLEDGHACAHKNEKALAWKVSDEEVFSISTLNSAEWTFGDTIKTKNVKVGPDCTKKKKKVLARKHHNGKKSLTTQKYADLTRTETNFSDASFSSLEDIQDVLTGVEEAWAFENSL